MNQPILRLYVLVIVMFALLIGFTSRWTVFEAAGLRSNRLNQRAVIEQEFVRRGSILAGDGFALARSVPGSGGTYHRQYPAHGQFAHALGYSYIKLGDVGLEKSYSSYLTGRSASGLDAIVRQLQGARNAGDNLHTSLDRKAQQVALNDLGGRPGAVVALDPHTGAVKVFASVPGFDPATLLQELPQLNAAGQSSPLLDRVTQGAYPPGSTFKVVADIAAIDSGRFTPQSVINGDSPKVISGTALQNDNNQSYGNITLTQALTNSVNTVWAQVGVTVGKSTLKRYMERLGFDQPPQLDLPPSELRASGEYYHGKILDPTSPLVDVGRLAFGQDKLEVTPLQMAMVAAAVANGGQVVAPHLGSTVIDPDGRTVTTVAPRVIDRAMSPQTAQQVSQMMTQVVMEGTGTAAALNGVQVAGKTGTAQTTVAGQSQVWFIAFAPVTNPRFAIAVTIERSSGLGGTVAAPIAKDVLQALLHG